MPSAKLISRFFILYGIKVKPVYKQVYQVEVKNFDLFSLESSPSESMQEFIFEKMSKLINF